MEIVTHMPWFDLVEFSILCSMRRDGALGYTWYPVHTADVYEKYLVNPLTPYVIRASRSLGVIPRVELIQPMPTS